MPLLTELIVLIAIKLASIDTSRITEIFSIVATGGISVATLYLTVIGNKLKINIKETKQLTATTNSIKNDLEQLNQTNLEQHGKITTTLDELKMLTKPIQTQKSIHDAIDAALEYSYEYAKEDIKLKGILMSVSDMYINLGTYLIDSNFDTTCKEVVHQQDVNLFKVQKSLKIILPERWETVYEKIAVMTQAHVKKMIKLTFDPVNAKEKRLIALIHVQVQEQLTMLNILLAGKIDGENHTG